jgi:hypothetical protein
MLISQTHLLDIVKGTHGAYHKLTILVGASDAERTMVLNLCAKEMELPVINISLHLSQGLLSKSRQQIALHAADLATDVVDDHYANGLCIDHTELLFDKALRLNPLAFLEDLSRNRRIVATWNGVWVEGELRYAEPGHPDHFGQDAKGYPVVMVKENELELHLLA